MAFWFSCGRGEGQPTTKSQWTIFRSLSLHSLDALSVMQHPDPIMHLGNNALSAGRQVVHQVLDS